ncbi:sigma-54-dependent transcriptional regulator [Shimia abyssi]|uniref:Two-component system C4-dicarboxylate transport response regulator DctD n=1 Tax=Shimia abyssi TaxID=1662395 RepID=A0A2P8F6T7_9RHOB|nr:sigma-54 dependent transcriptional regulator [Shimia abyssi]PSL17418.1 two-component system C4-dicarboxylate transport response regulator DctD [Shimia abyssi]
MSGKDAFRILIADDDKAMRQSLSALMEAAGWIANVVPRAEIALERMGEFAPDVILSDVRMPGMSGLELLAALETESAPPLVLISAHGDIPMAVQAMQDGAYSFVEKPYDPRRLLSILGHAADQSRMRVSNARLKHRLFQLSGLDRVLVGQTSAVEALRQDILDFAGITAPVLIEGETGTGKELVARALHDLSGRADAPFLALNCATLVAETFDPETLAQATGGTVFLDEVGSCPLPVQAQLLRVIEQGLDGADLRFVAATNADIEASVLDGSLRQDFVFRLNTLMLNLPPLRQRRDDLTLLAAHFLSDFARVYEVDPPELNQDDLAALMAHSWPGNVRELRNACERRVLMARRGGGSMTAALRGEAQVSEVPDTLREAVAAFEREIIGKAIRAHEGRMDAVADALGIGRRTLNEKIVKLGLDKAALLE